MKGAPAKDFSALHGKTTSSFRLGRMGRSLAASVAQGACGLTPAWCDLNLAFQIVVWVKV
jgi:hypothetical protein